MRQCLLGRLSSFLTHSVTFHLFFCLIPFLIRTQIWLKSNLVLFLESLQTNRGPGLCISSINGEAVAFKHKFTHITVTLFGVFGGFQDSTPSSIILLQQTVTYSAYPLTYLPFMMLIPTLTSVTTGSVYVEERLFARKKVLSFSAE